MKTVWQFLSQREPTATAGALMAVFNLLQVIGVIDLTGDQLAGINTAAVTVLTYLVRGQVTPPTTKP